MLTGGAVGVDVTSASSLQSLTRVVSSGRVPQAVRQPCPVRVPDIETVCQQSVSPVSAAGSCPLGRRGVAWHRSQGCPSTVSSRDRRRLLGQASDSTISTTESSQSIPPFHLAIPVRDLKEARDFYGGKLGLPEGRSASTWVDYNLYGHQVVCHEVQGYNAAASANAVDGDPVPVPHFGLALKVPQFHDLARRLKQAGIKFVIEPHLRFQGQPGEQWTMFFKDSSSNALEFKAMTHPENLFARYRVDE